MNPALNHLFTPPFDALTTSERKKLAAVSQIIYLPEHTAVNGDWQGDLFIVIKGKLTQHQHGELVAGLNVGDWFSLADKDGVAFDVITQEQSLLYRLDGDTVHAISQHNERLRTLLFADLTTRKSEQDAQSTKSQSQQLLYRPVASIGEHIRTPNFIDENASLYEATCRMMAVDAKHILVSSPNGVGIFTQTDVCHAITKQADFATTCVKDYSRFNLYTIHESHDLSEALITMISKSVHRLPIVNDAGEITGVIGQTELLNYLTNHSQLITQRIDQAQNLDEVLVGVEMIGTFIRQQNQSGMKVHVIGRIVQSLNIHVFTKVWQLIAPPAVIDNTCLIVMGSEGRGEQIMRTDQDNALIIRDGFDDPNLPTYAQAFNDALLKLGYPYCDGNIMITSPTWRKSLTDFKAQVSTWMGATGGEMMIHFATLMDAHPVCGDVALFYELKSHWQHAVRHAHANFINRFAAPTIQVATTEGFWQKFTGGKDSDIDLKKAGIFPIVHGVRALALEYGIDETSTRLRLRQLASQKVIDEKIAQNITEALEFFLSKRLAVSLTTDDKSARKVNPNTLSALERDLLKESLAVVKYFKGFITRHYRLDVFVG
ncbi:DUF294 nucleotidyltransferase-like domain-containing protein [Moraxella bovoculi]|uniref:DUF294 nucleotidyltransferase-like domain-containing protein n=1 Tax=Moraxella bovoculi TaxID=386891 RepID=UPI000624B959|nr:DUF294 nucleotidyltransferase-like domain-containing protein [Moraxella bovoculi]AKG17750.1 CBS domain-containing protein [Moraxella bovoculi]